ncbi:MAG: hypothetical protein JWN25_1316 [Verrucomicrobiales bacterium]|nr:hypothetical protein [Verrucomicrobiales bacterium]
MNNESCCSKSSRCFIYAIAIIGSLLVMFQMARLMRHYTTGTAIGTDRAQERMKNITELRSQNAEVLDGYAYSYAANGIIRIPVSKAVELTLQEYKDPAAGRSNLISRATKAFAPPPSFE